MSEYFFFLLVFISNNARVSRNCHHTPLNRPSIMFEQIAMDVSYSILHVYRSRRSTSLLLSRKKRRKCTCVRWYADRGSQSRLGTSFLGYDGRLFTDALGRYQTRRYHLRLIIDSSKACDSRTTVCSDLFFRVIDILGRFNYSVSLQHWMAICEFLFAFSC